MLYDIDFSWIILIAILIGLSFAIVFITEEKFSLITVLIYMTIINAFIVATDMFPLWTEVLFILIIVALSIIKLKTNKGMI